MQEQDVTKKRIEEKISALRWNNSSNEIFEKLRQCIDEWYFKAMPYNFEVYEVPYEIRYTTKLIQEVLDDLMQYTDYALDDKEIPQHLRYIEPFWRDSKYET